MELREAAYRALCETQATDKVQAVQQLWLERERLSLDAQATLQDSSHKAPGRPDQPLLQNPQHDYTRALIAAVPPLAAPPPRAISDEAILRIEHVS
jgi:uncharacterized ferritin-like protein (DUF455 family)